MSDEPDIMREQFEAWARENGLEIETWHSGQYHAEITRTAWKAWQASIVAAIRYHQDRD